MLNGEVISLVLFCFFYEGGIFFFFGLFFWGDFFLGFFFLGIFLLVE